MENSFQKNKELQNSNNLKAQNKKIIEQDDKFWYTGNENKGFIF